MSNKKNLGDGVKVDMVRADEMTEDERRAIFNRESSVDAIPDLTILSGYIYDILVYLEKKETKKLLKINESAVRMLLNEKYADSVPLGIIDMLMEEDNKEENIDRIVKILESLKRVKRGELSIEDGLNNLTDDINERYCYSKYGSKEEFEKALAMEICEEQKNKRSGNIEEIRKIGKVKIKN
jgi:hypothetical protein